MRTPAPKPKRGASSPTLSARLGRWARIEAHGNGAVVAVFDTGTVSLGRFGASAAGCLQELRSGLPLSSLVPGNTDKEIDLLIRRLAPTACLSTASGGPETPRKT